MHTNERKVIEMYVLTLLNSTLTSSDSSTLVDITNQCPLEGGKAVFYARSLLNGYTDTIRTWPDTTCVVSQSAPRQRIQKPTNDLKVYPNPVDHRLTVKWEDPQSVKMKYDLQVIDLRGRIVLTRESTRYKTQVEVEHLPAGMYLARMISEHGITRTACFIK